MLDILSHCGSFLAQLRRQLVAGNRIRLLNVLQVSGLLAPAGAKPELGLAPFSALGLCIAPNATMCHRAVQRRQWFLYHPSWEDKTKSCCHHYLIHWQQLLLLAPWIIAGTLAKKKKSPLANGNSGSLTAGDFPPAPPPLPALQVAARVWPLMGAVGQVGFGSLEVSVYWAGPLGLSQQDCSLRWCYFNSYAKKNKKRST